MSLRANPTAIGIFMIGALALTVLGVATLASKAWLGNRPTFISFFEESVNGLERGAAVKFQGVPVGTVSKLLIQINQTDKTFLVPVEYEIELTRLTTVVGEFLELDAEEVLERQIADGLRAQLQMESLVTGILYIELSYNAEAELPEPVARRTAFPEIPTTPSLIAVFGTKAGSLVASVFQILVRVNEMLEEVDMKGLNEAVVASAQAVERLVASPELQAAINEVPGMAEQFGRTLTEFEKLGDRLSAAVEPLQSGMEGTLNETNLTLQAARKTIEETQGLIDPDSGIGYGMERTLTSLREAADALRTLVITLERNPDMLIRGTNPPRK